MKRNKKRKKIGYMKASYTVEAAFVLPLILVILAVFLYMIFYLHDMYVLRAYANRMAQECCWNYIENEHADQEQTSRQIIQAVDDKYKAELEDQLLMSRLTDSLGTCKKNRLTQIYTATWRVVGEPVTFMDMSVFYPFKPVVYEASYHRIHIRSWFYSREVLKGAIR